MSIIVKTEQIPPSHAYHGVLSHQDDGFATKGVTDLVHLLRADIVNAHDEDGTILVKKGLELIEVSGLGC